MQNIAKFNTGNYYSQSTIAHTMNTIESTGTDLQKMEDGLNIYCGAVYTKAYTSNSNFEINIKTSLNNHKTVAVNVLCGGLGGRYPYSQRDWKHYIMVYSYSGSYAYIFDPWYDTGGGYYTLSFSTLQQACAMNYGAYYYSTTTGRSI